MARLYDRPISIQRINEDGKTWDDVFKVHARINKSASDNEYLGSGAVQGKKNLMFEMRYFKALEDISLNIQSYRIIYQGIPYDIRDFDDYMLQHKTVKILGVSY